MDLRDKDLVVNLETMEMFAPLRGALRRTHYDGVKVDIGVSDKDYSLHAKIGYIQVYTNTRTLCMYVYVYSK